MLFFFLLKKCLDVVLSPARVPTWSKLRTFSLAETTDFCLLVKSIWYFEWQQSMSTAYNKNKPIQISSVLLSIINQGQCPGRSPVMNWLPCYGTVLNSTSATAASLFFGALLSWRSHDLSSSVWKIYDPAFKSMGTLWRAVHRLMDHFFNLRGLSSSYFS